MKRVDPLEALKKNPFILAPMAGITDHAFRSFMRKRQASLVVTELISAHGLDYKSERTIKLMSFDESQRPVGIQIFGEGPEVMARAAQIAAETGCDFIDINFGCPVPKVVKKGAGSAMLKDLPAMTELLRAVKKAVDIPVTIKVRTGWDSSERNSHEVCNIAFNEGISWVAIHGRTRAQGYAGLADWDFIGEIKSKAKLPIIGNGDVLTGKQAVLRFEQSGCDGIMIGRGALKNPQIFVQARDLLSSVRGHENKKGIQENPGFQSAFRELVAEIFAHCDARVCQIQVKKFAAWFATGYPGASQFRKSIFQISDSTELISFAEDFFSALDKNEIDNRENEDFLMGGHG
jgi:nifR3 family TIM-barrel protein